MAFSAKLLLEESIVLHESAKEAFSTREWLGFILSPIPGPAVLLGSLPMKMRSFGDLWDLLGVLAFLWVFILPFAYAAGVCLGLPVYLLLRKLRIVRWWTLFLGGIAVGMATPFVLVLPVVGLPSQTQEFVLACGLYGSSSGVVFWAISLCRPRRHSFQQGRL